MGIQDFFCNASKAKSVGTNVNLVTPWEIPHQKTTTAEDVFYCFRLILGRSPHREEWSGHVAQAGTDLDHVVRAYIGSLEFSKRSSVLLKHQLND